VVPHGTPPTIVQKINADLQKALARPELLMKFQELGNYTRSITPAELADFVHSERRNGGRSSGRSPAARNKIKMI
jgi:tripartite-type tricarboxylate transporter receptor subunit TctC